MTATPIQELALPFDSGPTEDRLRRRRRQFRSRLVSLALTVVVLGVIYLWQRDQFRGAGVVTLYGVVVGVSVLACLGYLIAYRRAKRALARVGTGLALRIGRPGVEIRGVYVPWSEVTALRAVKPGLGRPEELQVTHTQGAPLAVPFDQLPTKPATLDTTARAYSGGRHGVDLSALDS